MDDSIKIKKIKMVPRVIRETDIPEPANIVEHIIQAQIEAAKRGIKANAVAISDKLYFSKFCHPGGDVPMICGLKCVYTKELPSDTLFAVFEAYNVPQTKDERIKALEAEVAKLRAEKQRIIDFINDNS